MAISEDSNTVKAEAEAERIRGIALEDAIERLKLAYRLYRSQPISIRMFGDHRVRSFYRDFTSSHRLLPWMAKKGFGAALLDLDDVASVTFSGTGRRYQLCRRRIRKAKGKSYSFRPIDPRHHVDEIFEINQSSSIRQGRALDRAYLDRDKVREVAEQEKISFGVFDKDGVLKAYAHTPILGEAFAFSYILGDAEHIEDGIMYLLVQQTLISMRERYEQDGFPRWALYDMFLGASPGLRQFKLQLGFKPYRVRWECDMPSLRPLSAADGNAGQMALTPLLWLVGG